MAKEKIIKTVNQAVKALQKQGRFSVFEIPEVKLDKPTEESYGDYSSNVAMKLTGTLKESPKAIAEAISVKIKELPAGKMFEKIEVAGPGFINFFLGDDYLINQAKEILKKGDRYGEVNLGKDKKIQVEFISANPTGPLTLGNIRGGFFGDALANILTKAGFKVERAYYINDYGNQIMALGHSVLKDKEAVYEGDYIDWLNKQIKEKDPYMSGEKAARLIIGKMIKKTVKQMGIKYNEWISETWLHKTGRVNKAIEAAKKRNLLYESEGALWFKSKQFGDIRDRVLLKGTGWKTYLCGDMALHQYKFGEKKFAKVINIWGADHYGDVAGLMGVVEALGHKGKLEIILIQFVTLMKNGKPFGMSKRKGVYVSVDEFLKMVNLDVARFFILQRSTDTHLNFDFNLAKEQSETNPVYYVQYAYARISSILRKVKTKNKKGKTADRFLKLLAHPAEMALIKQLVRLPEIVEQSAKDYQLQRLPQYVLDLAAAFHQFYRDCQVLSENKTLTEARLALILAAKIVLKNTLSLMGISSPEKM